ncbi:hypothetical protein U5A82_19715 [Sphingobium sp. CR2-8]|uniref:hypothetical protein n=1 Tax=Sphingobium sp. CR2-8 TaxID=1306534 RepID=UPI002DB762B3|nr:hypothetical protein [Sphingobium sp. CR2-8]MEC3912619.1 hypothetical protein [Sphingobium sp. CR2-8]
MFFGVRLRSLFTSRWFALLWAILVIMTAIQFVGPGDDSPRAQGDNATAADGLTNDQRQAIANAF